MVADESSQRSGARVLYVVLSSSGNLMRAKRQKARIEMCFPLLCWFRAHDSHHGHWDHRARFGWTPVDVLQLEELVCYQPHQGLISKLQDGRTNQRTVLSVTARRCIREFRNKHHQTSRVQTRSALPQHAQNSLDKGAFVVPQIYYTEAVL